MHQLTGTRFGVVEFGEDDVVTFTDGLIGFANLTRFVLISTKEDSPFRWLQSLDQPSIAFLLADPNRYVLDYSPEITDAQAQEMGLDTETPMLIFTTACIPAGQPNDMTLNLAGPIIVNLQTQTARQLVIEDPTYPTKYRVFQEAAKAA